MRCNIRIQAGCPRLFVLLEMQHGARIFGVFNFRNDSRAGHDIRWKHFLPKHGIYQGAFAGLELAGKKNFQSLLF